jgi:hypothetical protein
LVGILADLQHVIDAFPPVAELARKEKFLVRLKFAI